MSEIMGNADWSEFPTSEDLAEKLADTVAQMLDAAVGRRGQAFLALSGGTTPKRFFEALSARDLEWDRIVVTLVDERFVPITSDRSNAALVRDNLLAGKAAAARFVGLYHEAADAEAAAGLATAELAALPWPLDVAVLGMGTDGHTASFFPDAPNLDDLLDPRRKELVDAVRTVAGGEPRLTLPLGRLVEAGFVVLHIEGKEKRRVLEEALQPGSTLPIAAVFLHARQAVPVYWTG